MSDVYVIRQRKDGGGWEYLQSDHVDDFWGGFATSRRTFDRPACTWNGQLCRMVPTVTWFARTKRGSSMGPFGSRDLVPTGNGWFAVKRTTWRAVPESEL